MKTETLTYHADGLNLVSTLYVGETGGKPAPGILVFPEAFGLGEHAHSKAQRLAEAGYISLACDLHGDAKQLHDMDSVMGILRALFQDPLRIRARAQGALDALLGRPEVDASRTAAIGFCFGGTMALELARGGAAIGAAVGFHSGLKTERPQDASNIKGKVLVFIGSDDPGVDADQRAAFEQEMRAGGVDWRMHIYGGVVHSFSNPAADALNMPQFARYNSGADSRSWREMTELFHEIWQ